MTAPAPPFFSPENGQYMWVYVVLEADKIAGLFTTQTQAAIFMRELRRAAFAYGGKLDLRMQTHRTEPHDSSCVE